MSDEAIQELCNIVFPNSELISSKSLPSGASFNNRIYFVKTLSSEREEEWVLKVNGRFFHGDKVRNEVSCLQILEKCCPDVPVPKVVAWSEDGMRIVSANGKEEMASGGNSGWILVSKLPGDTLSSVKLEETETKIVAKELGDIVASWRLNIQSQNYSGNVTFHADSKARVNGNLPLLDDGRQLSIEGLLTHGIERTAPIRTVLEYYTVKLNGYLEKLRTQAVFAQNRHLIPLLETFIASALPKLTLFDPQSFTDSNKFVFTHYDLSPRNILVSTNPLGITGIVDFEFSGFFPQLDEFVNDTVGNDGDWMENVYQVYMERLAEKGVVMPKKVGSVWKEVCDLGKLEENVAPWWLAEGGVVGEKLVSELDAAASVVKEVMEKLGRT